MEYWLVYMERKRQSLALASTVMNNTQITWLLLWLYLKVYAMDNYWISDYLFLWFIIVSILICVYKKTYILCNIRHSMSSKLPYNIWTLINIWNYSCLINIISFIVKGPHAMYYLAILARLWITLLDNEWGFVRTGICYYYDKVCVFMDVCMCIFQTVLQLVNFKCFCQIVHVFVMMLNSIMQSNSFIWLSQLCVLWKRAY